MHFSKKKFVRIVSIILVLVMANPVTISASVNDSIAPRASDYLNSYNTYAYNAAWGKIQIYFDVTGVRYMDELGTLSIKVFESTDQVNWTWVETYTNGDTPSMLGYDDIYYSNHVDYAGTIGRYYKAYVCIWAGKDGDGDTRYMWTQPVKATLFAG